MANKFYIIRDLEKQYARLLGLHIAADHQVEDAVGLKAIDDATARVAAERLELERHMAAIRDTIHANYDVKWSPRSIKPIRPPVTGAHGDLSAAVYRILKETDAPLSTKEIVNRVREQLGLDQANAVIVGRVRSGVTAILKARVEDGLVLRTDNPTAWRRTPRPRLTPVVSANILPTPWR